MHSNYSSQWLLTFSFPNFQVNKENLVTADYAGKTGWGRDDPSIFKVTVNGTAHGEYQVTNGYGPKKAAQIMRVGSNGWTTYQEY